MADMSAWDRLAHWTSSSLENLVGTGQGTGTVFGPPEGASWADWRNPTNWAQPGEPGGRPVEYTGGGTADTGAPLDSRWLEVNAKSDMIAPAQQVYIGPGARQPDWAGARKPWVDPDTGRPFDPSVESGAPRPTWVDPDTGRPFNPGGGGPAGGGQGFGGGRMDPRQQQGPHDRFGPGGAITTGLGAPSTVTGTPFPYDPAKHGMQGGDPFTEDDNMPRSYAPGNWQRGPSESGAGDWRNPNADPFPARDPDNVTGINPAGKPRDPSWGMPQANPRWQEGGRIGGGSMRIMDYPQIKKGLQDKRQMYMDMFGRGEIGHEELAREIADMEPKMQEVLHWEAQQAWDAEQRGLQAQLREKFEGWSAAQIREWFKNNPDFLGQGNPGFWQRYGKKQSGDPSSRREFGPGIGPAGYNSSGGGTVMLDEVIAEDVVAPGGGNVTGVEAPSPSGGSTRYPITGSEGFEAQERAKARVRVEVAEEAEAEAVEANATVQDDANFIIMVEDFATDIIKGTPHHKGGKWTMDQVPREYKEAVRAEIAKRKAALKRA